MVTHKSSHQRLALLAFSGGIFCIQLDAFALNLALLQIGRDLEAPEGWLKWVVGGYLLSVGMFMLAAGRLSDRFGYRRLLMIGLSVLVWLRWCVRLRLLCRFLFSLVCFKVWGALASCPPDLLC